LSNEQLNATRGRHGRRLIRGNYEYSYVQQWSTAQPSNSFAFPGQAYPPNPAILPFGEATVAVWDSAPRIAASMRDKATDTAVLSSSAAANTNTIAVAPSAAVGVRARINDVLAVADVVAMEAQRSRDLPVGSGT
jgi:hypothetical protein